MYTDGSGALPSFACANMLLIYAGQFRDLQGFWKIVQVILQIGIHVTNWMYYFAALHAFHQQ